MRRAINVSRATRGALSGLSVRAITTSKPLPPTDTHGDIPTAVIRPDRSVQHPPPSPHQPPPLAPMSSEDPREPERKREAKYEQLAESTELKEAARALHEMVDAVERAREVGELEVAEKLERVRKQLEEMLAKKHHDAEKAARHEHDAEQRHRERQLQRDKEDREREEARQKRLARDRELAQQREAAMRHERAASSAKAAAERRVAEAAEMQREAEQRRLQAERRAQRQQAEARLVEQKKAEAAKMDTELARRLQKERELEAKQERERQERQRWFQQHKEIFVEAPPAPAQSQPSTAAATTSASTDEAERAAVAQRAAEQEQRRKQLEAQIQAAAEARRLAEEKRTREEAEKARREAEELAKFLEARKIQEAKDRELSARIAREQEEAKAKEVERQKKDNSEVIMTQASRPPPPPQPTASAAAIVTESPPPPPTPPPAATATGEQPRSTASTRDRLLPYALIATGGGLLYWAFTRERPVELPPLPPAPLTLQPALPVTAPTPVTTVHDAVNKLSVAAKPQAKAKSTEPQFPLMPTEPPMPSIDVADLTALSSSLSSDVDDSHLKSMLDTLLLTHLQQQHSLLSALQAEENEWKKQQLLQSLHQLKERFVARIQSLKSGVTISFDAPALSLPSSQTLTSQSSNDELQSYLASLKKQLEILSSSSEQLNSQATVTAINNAKTQLARQFEAIKADVEREFRELTAHLYDVSRDIHQQRVSTKNRERINEIIDELIQAERQRWQSIQSSELQQQRFEIVELIKNLFFEQRESLEAVNDAEREQRRTEIEDLNVKIKNFYAISNALNNNADISAKLHSLSLALLALEGIIHSNDGTTDGDRSDEICGWQRFHRIRLGDPLIDTVLKSIPDAVMQRGLIGNQTLIERWHSTVKGAIKEEIFVPQHSSERSVWAHLVGKLFALVYITPPVDPLAGSGSADQSLTSGQSGDLESLATMDSLVAVRDWRSLLAVESKLSPHVRAINRDWIQQVHERATAELALEAIQARTMCLAMQM